MGIMLHLVLLPTALLRVVLTTLIGLLETVMNFLTVSNESETEIIEEQMVEVTLKNDEKIILVELIFNKELGMIGGEDRLNNMIFINNDEIKTIIIYEQEELH